MTREQIKEQLWNNHQDFCDYIQGLNETDFLFSPSGKWTAGQQLDHLYRSVRPLANALILPPFFLKLLFGKNNRPGKSYEALVEKYHAKLSSGGKASGRFIPKEVSFDKKQFLSGKLLGAVKKLNRNIDSFSEKQLDEYILPHPLLGKVTIREMMYFTVYHVQHHHNLIKHALLKNGVA